jgi:molecular chaperone GrpE
MMTNKNKQSSTRIPVRFVDEESTAASASTTAAAAAADDDSQNTSDAELDESVPSAEEIGEASIYEDATEVQRRIDRGAEEDHSMGRGEADDKDVAGGPTLGETPEQREDLRNRRGSNESANESANNSNGEANDANDNTDASAPPIVMDAAGPTLAELVATRSELKRVEAARVDLLDKLARRQADFDNYRKRVERERGEAYNRVVADVVGKLLPVVDNLRRALDAEAMLEASESKEFRHFLNGVELISKQLDGVLEGLGLESVAAVGETFDPHVHEAVATEQTEDYEPDTVMQELVRGYRLGEKLLRPAIVKVATR